MEDNKINLDVLVIRIGNSTSNQLKADLLRNAFTSDQIPYVEAWIKKLEEDERNAPVTMYHRRKAPNGKVFKAYELPALEKKGWVDSQEKFKEGIISKIKKLIKVVIKSVWAFWCKEYKWILGFIVTLIALYLTYLKLTKGK